MKNLRSGLTFAALSLSVSTLALPAFGQEGPGRQGVLSFSHEVELDVGGGPNTTTELGLLLSTSTRTQTLSFGLGTEIIGEFGSSGNNKIDVTNPSAELRYAMRRKNSALSFSAQYREIFLGDDEFETVPGIFIFGEDGLLTRTNYSASFETGLEAPFGLRLDAGYRDIDYENTVDPDLIDQTFRSVDALATFRLSPVLSLRARAGIEYVDEADFVDIERENSYYGLGIGGVTRGGLTFSADVLFDETEVTSNLPSFDQTDGVGFEISASQARPNGSLGGSLSSRTDDAGQRNTATINRDFDLRNGSLALAFGVVDQEGISDLQYIGNVAYSAETPRGTMSARLDQRAVSDRGDTIVSTNLILNYAEEVTSYSGWEAEVSYIATDELVGAEDEKRTRAKFTYRYDLTQDWTMNTGIEISSSNGASPGSTVFFNIERDITFGF